MVTNSRPPHIKLAIVRPTAHLLRDGYYNSQEIGCGRSLIPYGFSTDIFVAGEARKMSVEIIHAEEGKQVRLFRMPCLKLPGHRGFFPHVFSYFDQGGYNLIQTHEDSELMSALIAIYARRRKIPLVLCQGIYQPFTVSWQKIMQSIFDRTLGQVIKNSIVCAIAKTSSAEQYLSERGYSNIVVLPPGLDVDNFSQEIVIDWRRELGIPDNARILLYVGTLEQRRNIDFLLELVRYIRERYDLNIYFLITGKARPAGGYENIHATVSENYIKFMGPLKQSYLPSLYNMADLFLLASNYEIYGMVILESLHFKVPVITTMTAGSKDILGDNRGGVVMKSMDLTIWGETVFNLLENPEELSRLASEGYENVSKRFTWASLAPRFADLYKELLLKYASNK